MYSTTNAYQPGPKLDATRSLLIGMKEKGTLQSYVAQHRNSPEYPYLLALASSISQISDATKAAEHQPPQQTVADQQLGALAPAPQTALPENVGIGQLPAPNLETVGKAAGGIIAFGDGGDVPRFNGEDGSVPMSYSEQMGNLGEFFNPVTRFRQLVSDPSLRKDSPRAANKATTSVDKKETSPYQVTSTEPTGNYMGSRRTPLQLAEEAAAKADTGKNKADEGIAKLAATKPSASKETPAAEKGLGSLAEFAKESNAYTGDDPTARQLARIEAQEAKAGSDKSDAFNMALMKAGLGMMSGTSQYAFENIGKGAMGGLEDYSSAMKDLKKAALERDKMRDAAEQAAYAYKRDDVKGYRAAKEKEADRRTEMEKAQLAASTTIQAANIGRSATLAAAQMPPKEAQMAAMLGTGKTFEERFQSGLPKLTAIQAGKFDPRKAYTEYLVAAQRSGTGEVMPFAEFAMQFAPRVSGGGSGTVLPRKD